MIYAIATLDTKPGLAPEVKKAALPLIAATLSEMGCVSYDLTADVGNENRLVFIGRWEGRDHLEAHFGTPHMQAFGAAVRDMLSSQKIEIIDPLIIEVN